MNVMNLSIASVAIGARDRGGPGALDRLRARTVLKFGSSGASDRGAAANRSNQRQTKDGSYGEPAWRADTWRM